MNDPCWEFSFNGVKLAMGKLESAETSYAFFLTLPSKAHEGELLNCNPAAVVPLNTCYLLHVNIVTLHLSTITPWV